MRRFMWVGCGLLIFLTGCLSNNSLADLSISQNNVTNLSRISLGMSECQVLGIMHTPYKQEAYQIGKDKYHVWLYITTVTAANQGYMRPMNLTPLTFKNCKLIATGYSYYNWLKIQKNTKEKARTHAIQLEDKKLENSIQEAVKPVPPTDIEPAEAPKEALSTNPISMSSPPKKPQKPKESTPAEPTKPEWNEEDQQTIEEESEQNFDFW